MAWIKSYDKEKEENPEASSKMISDPEFIRFIVERMTSRYKLRQRLLLMRSKRGDSGNCNYVRMGLKYPVSVYVIAHEITHAIQLKKIPVGTKHISFHNKKQRKLTKKLCDYIMKALPMWETLFEIKKRKKEASLRNKELRTKEQKAKKTSLYYKCELCEKAIKRWNAKKKRAENAIKKLNRRRKLYMSRSEREQKFFQKEVKL